MDNRSIAMTLGLVGDVLEIRGDNVFKVRAYRSAARTIERITDSLAERIAEGTFFDQKIAGVGAGLQQAIVELVETGGLGFLDELRATIPAGLLDLLAIPGLGPKKIHRLWTELEISDLDTLQQACTLGSVASLSGFGVKSQSKILSGIEFLQQHVGRTRLGDAWPQAEKLLESLRESPRVIRASLAGSIRRGCETVGDMDLVVSSENPEEVMEFFVNLDLVHEVISRGPTKTTVRLPIGIRADLRVVDDEEFPTTVAHFTGSKEHNIQMRRLARERGWKISEYGVFDGDQKHLIRDEHDFYDLFGLEFIPPELREGQGEIEAAESGTLPRLVDKTDLVGVLHAHTTWSDGRQSIEEMALAARDLGYRYLGITDHSQVAGYAGGLDPDRLQRQREEIEALREKELGIDILAGSEVDILADGGLDFSDSVLEGLDFVIASIHSGFGQSREVMTDRICSALSHSRVDILAHPTGRLLLTREPYAVDLERVLEVALETGTVLEINANPHRLDLDAVWARRAKEMGISLLLGPDAHHVGGFAVMRYGLATARRAWLTAGDVINSLPLEALRKRLKGGRG